MKVISLGWGVQSFALCALSALGVLPRVDFALHSDTGWERTETLEFAARWTPWLEERGIRVVTVRSEMYGQKWDEWKGVFIPAFTTYENGACSGMLRRQCSGRWKIDPIRRWQSAELKRRGLKKTPGVIESWLGFTLDEAHRVSGYGVKYITKRYPFLEMLERPWTRGMVVQWLRENDLEVPVKSSCIICPFHSDRLWREMQLADNGNWERAIEVDRAIRHRRPGYLCYLHGSRKPLEEHDFTRQLSYW
jgi:hypothetical protein